MPIASQKITPCLWFDTKGEDAAKFYCAVFPNSKILNISHYGKEGYGIHGRTEGTVMTVSFTLDGQEFVALGGPHLIEMVTDPDAEKSQRVVKAFLQMKKFDIAALERAYDGVAA